MMIVWRTVLCCVVYDSCAQWYTRAYEQFLKMSVGLDLGLVFVHLFRFNILSVFFWFRLNYFVNRKNVSEVTYLCQMGPRVGPGL